VKELSFWSLTNLHDVFYYIQDEVYFHMEIYWEERFRLMSAGIRQKKVEEKMEKTLEKEDKRKRENGK
jgi:hypothetical protein